MTELSTILLIVFPVITYFIGRYFGTQSQINYKNLEKARDYWKDSNERRWEKIKELEIQVRDLQVENAKVKEDGNFWFKDAAKIAAELNHFKFYAAKFQLVVNKEKHPAANDNYLYVEGELNGNREAGLFTLNDWSKAKERLLKNPEDKPLSKTN